MNPAWLAHLANHLWQSTFFAGIAWLLTLALRNNRARVRHWVWLAASCKFLIPFSVLISLGGHIQWRSASQTAQSGLSVVDKVSQPFALPPASPVPMPPALSEAIPIPAVLLAIWACGFLGIACSWRIRWRRLSTVVRAGSPVPLKLRIRAVSSPAMFEPGIFGVFRPVLLLPEGICDRLTAAQLNGIIAHELCHVYHWDNLIATVHMFVETAFWFHPLVWWVGRRMVEERERACDEEVLRLGSEPRVYAEGILNVCKFYLESPLACASGVTGSDLKKRIENIMANHAVSGLSLSRKLLLSAAGTLLLGGPIVIGLVNTPQGHAQSRPQEATGPEFEVASVKPNKSGQRGGRLNTEAGHLTITNLSLRTCIKAAFGLQDYQLSGGAASIEDEPYDIVAKADGAVGDDQLLLMLRRLLADRFKLSYHRESKEMQGFGLLVAKNGHKLHEVQPAGKGWSRNGVGSIEGQEVSMARLAEILAGRMGQPVLDLTAIKGLFDLKLNWTPDPAMVRNPTENKESPAVSDPSGPSIFSALQEQLGLRLEARKVPVDIVVIDHVETPSEN